MSKTIICPNCGMEINLDNAEYAAIVNQIRNHEFNEEVSKRIAEERRHISDEIKLAESNAKISLQNEMAEKDQEILELTKKLKDTTDLAVKKVRQQDSELSNMQTYYNSEIAKLQEQLRMAEERQVIAVNNAINAERQQSHDKDTEIVRLNEQINTINTNASLQITNISNEKDQQISALNAEISKIKAYYETREAATEERHLAKLTAKDEEIQFHKNFKSKQSTKMIGESLEVHCMAEYARIRPLLPNSSFEKDNMISESGSKGDFIFRTRDSDGSEITSIMFECKNESEESLHKHKNFDFIKELDKDRREKGCEFAILVSTLEQDSEMFNQGIVDVSDQYPKMYVIRPQYFVPMITLINSMGEKTAAWKQELETLKSQNVDVSTFESDLKGFKEAVFKSLSIATKKKDGAIDKIDRAIKLLQDIKEDFISFDKQMQTAENKAEKVTIRKLTSNAPAIAAMLQQQPEDEQVGIPEVECTSIVPLPPTPKSIISA